MIYNTVDSFLYRDENVDTFFSIQSVFPSRPEIVLSLNINGVVCISYNSNGIRKYHNDLISLEFKRILDRYVRVATLSKRTGYMFYPGAKLRRNDKFIKYNDDKHVSTTWLILSINFRANSSWKTKCLNDNGRRGIPEQCYINGHSVSYIAYTKPFKSHRADF